MMKNTIAHRHLTDEERRTLAEVTHAFPHIGFISEAMWKKFGACYVITVDDKFAGVCAMVPLRSWLKLGPLIILEEFQGQGLGKQLIQHIVTQHAEEKLYIGSSNPAVANIVEKFHFYKEPRWFRLPRELQLYQITYFLERLSPTFLLDALRKQTQGKKGQYFFFYRNSNG